MSISPPFSITIPNQLKGKLPSSFIYADKSSSENLFLERWYQFLGEKGRLSVILPESFFDTGENRYARLLLFKYFDFKAIISLPTVTFDPYTQTRTGILFAQKKTKEDVQLFGKALQKFKAEFERLAKEFNDINKQRQINLIESEENSKNRCITLVKELGRD